jgi:hypothetical protein
MWRARNVDREDLKIDGKVGVRMCFQTSLADQYSRKRFPRNRISKFRALNFDPAFSRLEGNVHLLAVIL